MRLNEQHMGAARRAIADSAIPHITLRYENFLSDPERVASEIGDFFRLDLDASDLVVRRELDHSGVRGRVGETAKKVVGKMPRPWKKIIKAVIPGWVVRVLLPERKFVDPEEKNTGG